MTAAALLVCVEDFSRCRECHRERDAGSDLCVGCRGRVLTAICHYREYLAASLEREGRVFAQDLRDRTGLSAAQSSADVK